MFSKRVENTVGKGEIARYEQFFLSPVFSKGLFPRGVIVWECVNSLPNDKNLHWSKLKPLNFPDDKINVNENLKFGLGRLENILGKGENAGIQHFLFFPKCF